MRSSQCVPISDTARNSPPSCGSKRQFQCSLGLIEGAVIWSADVDHVDGWVLYQIIEGFITAIQAECASGLHASVRRAAQQSFYLDTLPPERFEMRSPHKSQTYHRGS